MSLSIVLIIAVAVLYASGTYLMLDRSLTRVTFGFLLVGNATNILILLMSGKPGSAPLEDDKALVEHMSDPLPQALILTAIVITFGITAFLLAMIYRSWVLANVDEIRDDDGDIGVRSRIEDITEHLEEDDTAVAEALDAGEDHGEGEDEVDQPRGRSGRDGEQR